jgi:polyisoprenoid-binding protein YceI
MAAGWNRKTMAYSVGGAVALVVAALVAYFVLFGNSPDEVSLESAVDSAESATATTGAESSQTETGGTETTESTGGIAGMWVVDTSIGEFSFEDATSSFVGFRVQEELATIGATEAVGRTPTIDGSLTIDGSTVTEVSLTADMTDIVTNNSQRNSRVQSALSTSEFPMASFTLTRPFDIPADLSDGDQFSVSAVGDLTIVGVTNEIEIPLEAQVVGDLVVVVGSVDISFDDWDVSVPSAPIVASAEDHGPLEMQLFFARG